MHFILLILLFAALIYGPQWWVAYTLRRYHKSGHTFSGTGGEFARHLLDQYQLQKVGVEVVSSGGDHYDPVNQMVRLTPEKHTGQSLTSVVVAAHEVGHAIQHAIGYPPFLWRQRLVRVSLFTEKAGSFLMFAAPMLGFLTRAPSVSLMVLLAAITTLGIGLLVQLVTLPVEWDASFHRALPVLASGYLPEDQLPAARRILKACAFTYVAGSLVGLLNFWRWMRMLKP